MQGGETRARASILSCFCFQEAVVEDTNMRCKDKKLGRPDSQSALFPKAESPQMDFGIPWGPQLTSCCEMQVCSNLLVLRACVSFESSKQFIIRSAATLML